MLVIIVNIVIYSIQVQKTALVTTIHVIFNDSLIYNCFISTIGKLQQVTFIIIFLNNQHLQQGLNTLYLRNSSYIYWQFHFIAIEKESLHECLEYCYSICFIKLPSYV